MPEVLKEQAGCNVFWQTPHTTPPPCQSCLLTIALAALRHVKVLPWLANETPLPITVLSCLVRRSPMRLWLPLRIAQLAELITVTVTNSRPCHAHPHMHKHRWKGALRPTHTHTLHGRPCILSTAPTAACGVRGVQAGAGLSNSYSSYYPRPLPCTHASTNIVMHRYASAQLLLGCLSLVKVASSACRGTTRTNERQQQALAITWHVSRVLRESV